jgi:hypothetical protein
VTVELHPANSTALAWARRQVERHHYLRSAPDPRSRPFCYLVTIAGERAGCLWFGRPESTRCYRGQLRYGSLADVSGGRAEFDRWEVLNLSRVWLSPDVQAGGRLCVPAVVPGFTDRKGAFRSTLATAVIHAAFARVGFDYLAAHPPCFPEQPYRIRAVLSYCDTRLHRGTIYRAAGMELARVNTAGIQTWWTRRVADLTPEQNLAVLRAAATHPRSRRIREQRRTLFDPAATGGVA